MNDTPAKLDMPADLPAILQAEIASIRAYLKAIEEACDAGFLPDMAGLDQRVGQLCTVLTAADPGIQKEILPEFKSLLAAFDNCETTIKKQAAAKS